MKNSHILIIEDDKDLQEAISKTLEISGYKTSLCSSAEEALYFLQEKKFQLIISDVNLGNNMSGLNFLKHMQLNYNNTPIILITAYASIENAVLAIKDGAVDYLAKPFIPEHLISLVQKYALSINPICQEPVCYNRDMQEIYNMAHRVAKSNVSVLITGESGTGKEVLAKYIHKNSSYKNGPFIGVNCAAIPENMLEAILFGHEKGAFTGAYSSTTGKFEMAQNGTILLDEIADMPLMLQTKILRVIQEKEVEKVGGKKNIPLNIRIIAATNKNLKQEVEHGNFREDLYFRLNVFPLHILPLRKREDEIIPLANYILNMLAVNIGRNIPELTDNAKKYLLSKKWEGNIRELENVLQRSLILQDGDKIQVSDLSLMPADMTDNQDESNNLDAKVKNQEYNYILTALQTHNGCRKEAAKQLGISTRTLRNKLSKMRECGITVPASNIYEDHKK